MQNTIFLNSIYKYRGNIEGSLGCGFSRGFWIIWMLKRRRKEKGKERGRERLGEWGRGGRFDFFRLRLIFSKHGFMHTKVNYQRKILKKPTSSKGRCGNTSLQRQSYFYNDIQERSNKNKELFAKHTMYVIPSEIFEVAEVYYNFLKLSCRSHFSPIFFKTNWFLAATLGKWLEF